MTGVRIGLPGFHGDLAAFDIIFRAPRAAFFRGAHQPKAKCAELLEGLFFDRLAVQFRDQVGKPRHLLK